MKDFSKTTKPLSSFLAQYVSFPFSQECEEAFNKFKEVLNYQTHPLPPCLGGKHLELVCDDSNLIMGVF